MAWYWWLLIGIGVLFMGYLKMKVLKKITSKKKTAQELDE